MGSYDTNLAAEYYVLSCLHRRGLAAALTLGNKKGVDILVALDTGDAATVEVKGVAGKHDWPVDNLARTKPKNADRHYVVLVSFEGEIENMPVPPNVWVIPFNDLGPFVKAYNVRTNVSRSRVYSDGAKYKHAWQMIDGGAAPVLDLSTPAARASVKKKPGR